MTGSAVNDAARMAPSRSERLDRLPFTAKHGRLLFGSGVGWALDAMDVGLISFVIAALIEQQIVTTGEASWIASIGFIGMAVGATLGGLIADRIGRRQVFAITLIIYGLATGASALASGAALLMVLRFFVGLGLGAELPVASTLVSEFAPKRIRGRLVVWLEAFWAVGWILAALIGTFVVASGENGWRWALALGMVPAAYAIVVRMGLPESVRFLEGKGRVGEAERIVREFEASAETQQTLQRIRESDAQAQAPADAVDGPEAGERPHIWSPGLRNRTIALWVIWFCINLSYYGAFTWIPSLLVADGFTLVKSFQFTLIITLAQLPGYAVAAWLIEVWGRRSTLAVFLAGSAVAAAFYGLSGGLGEGWIIAAGCLLSFFNLGAWGALYAIGPELYPTNIRGTGAGAAAGFGRIASIIAPLLVPGLVAVGGGSIVPVFTVFAIAFAIAAGAALVLPEQRGRSLA
ncbi:MFS transporter [Gulosibacter sp. ACHW.36C]|uniref:MFS transporter n=1 Tax=Gulosibacter sediminis TaxID=1729695 RepID=A0ABY4MZD4_9MICO|nr:MFS transporter [Gulosibacter sediminis]UQN15795.1 MFS transporter [Gulosibacter sediminis]